MKNNSYFVKSIVTLSLISSVAMASDNDLEINDDKGKDIVINSSIQVPEDSSEYSEKMLAKLDVSDVVKIVHNNYDGKLVQVKLENENHNLVYKSELIKKDSSMFDITIDAGNGAILLAEADNIDKEESDRGELEDHAWYKFWE